MAAPSPIPQRQAIEDSSYFLLPIFLLPQKYLHSPAFTLGPSSTDAGQCHNLHRNGVLFQLPNKALGRAQYAQNCKSCISHKQLLLDYKARRDWAPQFLSDLPDDENTAEQGTLRLGSPQKTNKWTFSVAAAALWSTSLFETFVFPGLRLRDCGLLVCGAKHPCFCEKHHISYYYCCYYCHVLMIKK